jgi:hypothetical protein
LVTITRVKEAGSHQESATIMSKLSISRGWRILAGLVVASAFAVAPMAARSAPGDLDGTLTAGSLTVSTPTLGNVNTTLNGANQTIDTTVGAWDVVDATGSNDGYVVTVAASTPSDTGGYAGTGGSITYTPQAITEGSGNPATHGPVDGAGVTSDVTPLELPTGGITVANAASAANTSNSGGPNVVGGAGQGEWDFTADSGATKSLAVVIPGDASAGTYSSTLTFTASTAVN